jgi:hypothetical protein
LVTVVTLPPLECHVLFEWSLMAVHILLILLFQITNKTVITLSYLTNLPISFSNPAGGPSKAPSFATLKLLLFEASTCDAR